MQAPKFEISNYPILPGDWSSVNKVYSYSAGPKIAKVALQWFISATAPLRVSGLSRTTQEYRAIQTLVALDKIPTFGANMENITVQALVKDGQVDSIAIVSETGQSGVSPYSRYLDDYQRYLYAIEGPISIMGQAPLRDLLRRKHDKDSAARDAVTKSRKAAHPPIAPMPDSKRQLKKAAQKKKKEELRAAAEKKAEEAKREKDLREALIKAEKRKVDPLASKLKAHAELASLEEKAAKSAAVRAAALRKADPTVEVSVDLNGWKLVTKPRRQRTAVFHTTGNAATRTNGAVDLKVEKTIKFGTA